VDFRDEDRPPRRLGVLAEGEGEEEDCWAATEGEEDEEGPAGWLIMLLFMLISFLEMGPRCWLGDAGKEGGGQGRERGRKECTLGYAFFFFG